jgi:cell division protein FtsB
VRSNGFKKGNWHRIFINKYFIAIFLFVAWILFFDENSIMVHQKNRKRLNELQMQKEYYIERIASDQKKLEDLNGGKEDLERYAREQYYMSKPDEEVFIIVEED